jgi:hypothetical protein
MLFMALDGLMRGRVLGHAGTSNKLLVQLAIQSQERDADGARAGAT